MSGLTSIVSYLGSSAFALTYEISPIFLIDGVAGSSGGGVIPIVSILQGSASSILSAALEVENVISSLASGTAPDILDHYFCHFNVLPGGSLIRNAIGKYPFANQSVAANAVIQQPLNVSLEMICPSSEYVPFSVRIGVITALQAILKQHTSQGGLFNVATPSFIYTNGILTDLVDITTGDTKQKQSRWQWNFEFPLITLDQAQEAQNTQIGKITNGVQTDGTSSGPNVSTGNPYTSTYPGFGGALVG